MKLKHILLLIPVLVAFQACSNGGEKSGTDGEEAATEQDTACTYTYQPAFTKLEWTAYKFTERAGVSGSFDHFTVTPASEEAGSVADLMEGMKFSIATSTVNSGNEERDPKIVKYFFGVLTDTAISGTLSNVKMEGNSGTANVSLMLNGNTSDVPAELTLNGDEIELQASVDVSKWDAQTGIDSLNHVCKDLHTGKDGKSILWPDVLIKVKSTLKSSHCD